MWDIISQVGIAATGIASIILVAKKNKWGFILGLASQPFWYITSFINEQWGIFFLNFAYTFSWGLGVYEWFFKKSKEIK